MLPNPWVILGAAGAWLASLALCGWLMYARGADDTMAAVTKQELAQANANIAEMKRKNEVAAKAGEKHNENVRVVRDTTREIVRTVTIPPDSDPYLPVGFVRLFDRAASREPRSDPYPGQSDGAPSDVRVSEAANLLVKNFGEYEACRVQLTDLIDYLRADRGPPPKQSLLDRIF